MERGEWEIEDLVLRSELSARFWQLLEVTEPGQEVAKRFAVARSMGPPTECSPYILSDELRGGPPPWMIGFSRQFKKDTKALDRKLMGRILEVISEIADYSPPLEPKGDTFKALGGDLAGYWRYRIGDHRLLLEPLPRRSTINLLSFGARGSVYE